MNKSPWIFPFITWVTLTFLNSWVIIIFCGINKSCAISSTVSDITHPFKASIANTRISFIVSIWRISGTWTISHALCDLDESILTINKCIQPNKIRNAFTLVNMTSIICLCGVTGNRTIPHTLRLSGSIHIPSKSSCANTGICIKIGTIWRIWICGTVKNTWS